MPVTPPANVLVLGEMDVPAAIVERHVGGQDAAGGTDDGAAELDDELDEGGSDDELYDVDGELDEVEDEGVDETRPCRSSLSP
jgi:hypothetical protein